MTRASRGVDARHSSSRARFVVRDGARGATSLREKGGSRERVAALHLQMKLLRDPTGKLHLHASNYDSLTRATTLHPFVHGWRAGTVGGHSAEGRQNQRLMKATNHLAVWPRPRKQLWLHAPQDELSDLYSPRFTFIWTPGHPSFASKYWYLLVADKYALLAASICWFLFTRYLFALSRS